MNTLQRTVNLIYLQQHSVQKNHLTNQNSLYNFYYLIKKYKNYNFTVQIEPH